jgi:dGTPase
MSALRSREAFENEEGQRLAAYAMKSADSRGRCFREAPHAYRTAFQRDRDRVVHARAFRRLEYKTQVFVHHEGDHYRNRLTHSVEAAQIARTIARALRLNEELAEAVALAHDLGHTPFGHAGERVLADLMREEGGFDHNRQSLRVVDWLEESYADFRGLNLTAETREGILKHGAAWEHPVALPPLGKNRSLEAQVANLADEIAYTNHDLDDGLRSGLLQLEELADVPLWNEVRTKVEAQLPEASETVRHAQTIVMLINSLVTDLLESSASRLDASRVGSVDAVRDWDEPLLAFSEAVASAKLVLKRFLEQNFYRHPHVLAETAKAETVLRDLFGTYRAQPDLLPSSVRGRFEEDGEARTIADYVAGMTDRFAQSEHARLLQ